MGCHEAQLWDKVGHVYSPHNNQLSELIGNRPRAGEHCPSGLLLTRRTTALEAGLLQLENLKQLRIKDSSDDGRWQEALGESPASLFLFSLNLAAASFPKTDSASKTFKNHLCRNLAKHYFENITLPAALLLVKISLNNGGELIYQSFSVQAFRFSKVSTCVKNFESCERKNVGKGTGMWLPNGSWAARALAGLGTSFQLVLSPGNKHTQHSIMGYRNLST